MDRNKETAVLGTIDEVIPIVQKSGRSALAISLYQAEILDALAEEEDTTKFERMWDANDQEGRKRR